MPFTLSRARGAGVAILRFDFVEVLVFALESNASSI